MVGCTAAESFLDNEAVNDEDGDGDDDMDEDNDNEYDVNNKRLHDPYDQQAFSSRKKTRLEKVIASYEVDITTTIEEEPDLDGQISRKCVLSRHGPNVRKNLIEQYPVIDEEGAELEHLVVKRKNTSEKKKLKKSFAAKNEYTNFLKDYSNFEVFRPLIGPDDDGEVRDKNQFPK